MAKTLTANDVAVAFNRHMHHLTATESNQCCGRGTKLMVVNQFVLLRRMMEDLGFSANEIDQHLHDRVAANQDYQPCTVCKQDGCTICGYTGKVRTHEVSDVD